MQSRHSARDWGKREGKVPVQLPPRITFEDSSDSKYCLSDERLPVSVWVTGKGITPELGEELRTDEGNGVVAVNFVSKAELFVEFFWGVVDDPELYRIAITAVALEVALRCGWEANLKDVTVVDKISGEELRINNLADMIKAAEWGVFADDTPNAGRQVGPGDIPTIGLEGRPPGPGDASGRIPD